MPALRSGLGSAWINMVVLVMIELGRTVRVSGTGGTNHGTATISLVANGAVSSGWVGRAWP